MVQITAIQAVEQFHLLFLDQLSSNMDKGLYSVKGGCNLRFFMQSIRYSEDIDIDVMTIQQHTLQNKVNRILDSQPFRRLLQTKGIGIHEYSQPKQTETTQRWKVQLTVPGASLPLPTKIEFSRRGPLSHHVFEMISALLVQQYGLTPYMASHYTAEKALEQKIIALAHRSQVQARDIFDIYFLHRQGVELSDPTTLDEALIAQAKNNALLVDYSGYKTQVVSYLHEEQQNVYDNVSMWDTMVQTILDF